MEPRITNPRAAADPVGYMDRVRGSRLGQEYKLAAIELLELRSGDSVLDVGCGPGAETLAFAALVGPSGRAVGIDTHDLMIEEARQRAVESSSSAEFSVRDVTNLDFENESFHRCYADRVLQRLGGAQQLALGEIVRVLVPGGHFVACAPDAGSFLLDIGERDVTSRILAFVANRGWQGGAMPNLLRDAGLVDLVLEARSGWTSDFAEVDSHTPLATIAQWAREAGSISEADYRLWVEQLEEAVERDRFSFGSTMLLARGTKPAPVP